RPGASPGRRRRGAPLRGHGAQALRGAPAALSSHPQGAAGGTPEGPVITFRDRSGSAPDPPRPGPLRVFSPALVEVAPPPHGGDLPDPHGCTHRLEGHD